MLNEKKEIYGNNTTKTMRTPRTNTASQHIYNDHSRGKIGKKIKREKLE